jgi:signal transduction histidine kinase
VKLQSKRNFVRYVSHEVRTPLNTVYLGLQLVIDEAKRNSGVVDVDMLESIMDSCLTSIDILNDLLLYDKLEDGLMMLDKRPENAKMTLERIIQPFTVQVYKCE